MITPQDIQNTFEEQKSTHPGFCINPSYAERSQDLQNLKKALSKYTDRFLQALKEDLDKHPIEAYCTEILPLEKEIDHTLKSLKKWMSPKPHKIPIMLRPGQGALHSLPKGQVLIIGPFNYPISLIIKPLIGAIAAGNRVILKPSEHTPQVSQMLADFIKELFPPQKVALFTGGREVVEPLLKLPFDHFFFTGSEKVGRIVYESAAKHLATVTLELGGKSPVIVWKDANLTTAAKKIIWGKFLNFGQTCVAPDYALVHKDIFDDFQKELQQQLKQQFPSNNQKPCCSTYYGRSVSESRQKDFVKALTGIKIIAGGSLCGDCGKLSQTLVTDVPSNHFLRKEEIFGPILPLISIESLDDIKKEISKHPYPLASYLYTDDQPLIKDITETWQTGATMIHDNVIHAGTSFPFGGVKTSGIGQYHGYETFQAFSNTQPLIRASSSIDVSTRYTPYKVPLEVIRKILPKLF